MDKLLECSKLQNLLNDDFPSVKWMSESSVKLCYDLLREKGEVPYPPPPMTKLASKSIQFRSDGNKHFSEYRNFEAFKCFNRAIAHAPAASQQLALAYGNRSAALFDLGQPEACVKDIDRALAIGCDESRKQKLLERRKKCANLKSSTKSNPIADEFRQSVLKSLTKTKSDIPCASEKLTLAYDSKKGRKIIANKDIKPGEVLVIEEPFTNILDVENFTIHCYYCLKMSYDLIPCDTCSYVMFCNDQCKAKAWDQYHKYECPVMFYLHNKKFGQSELIGLRVTLKARYEYKSWAELKKIVSQLDAESDPMKKGFVNGVYRSKSYAPIRMFEKHLDKRPEKEILWCALAGVNILSLLRDHTAFLDESSDEDMWFAGSLLVMNILTLARNLFDVTVHKTNNREEIVDSYEYGCGIYPFMNLFNHSCTPKTFKYFIGNTSVLLCMRPIKVGEEVTNCYALIYGDHDQEHRQKILFEQFYFVCDCEACKINQIPYQVSTRNKKLTKQLILREDWQINSHTAVKRLDEVYHNLNILKEHPLSTEYLENIDELKSCWLHLGNLLPSEM